jgi:hypothetical protein
LFAKLNGGENEEGKWMVAHLDNGQNGLKFQINGILEFPSIYWA